MFKRITVSQRDIIPENLDVSRFYSYATEYSSYVESYCDLEDEPFVEEDRRNTMLSMFAYLYNAKNFKPLGEESAEEFYKRCMSSIDRTLMLFRENAKKKKISLPAYINELKF